MADDRTYIKIHDGMPDHPKIARVGGDAAWLNICAIAYCSRQTTDGRIPASQVPRISDRRAPMKLAAQLVDAGIWHDSKVSCEGCPLAEHDEYVIHDYLEHQRSKAQIEAMKEQRRSAGRSGGLAKAKRDAKQVAKQTASKSVAVSEEVLRTSQTEAEETSGEPDVPPRIDVEQTCSRLAEWIERNGSKKPGITQGWRDAARLMLDRDGRTLDESLRLIDWCQRNDFWRANILSMPKFREKYDQMRLQAVAQSQPQERQRVSGVFER